LGAKTISGKIERKFMKKLAILVAITISAIALFTGCVSIGG